ncbi:peptidoglycan-binding protein [Alkalihalobacterium sp. APHAB7]|uniref:C40 family peptidase n=1 Tax=Alkalihalobacterium sp. APHAB7 TaxID=3402081 RepID=UPI003AAF1CBF
MSTKSVVKKAVISSTFATGIVLTAPLVVDAALGDQPLKKGMNHSDVKELQEVLKAKGYFNFHTATGFYGTITEEAVRQFQQTHGIQTTGVANLTTINLLLNTTAQHRSGPDTQIASATTSNTYTTLAQTRGLLRSGSQGQAVTELQQILKEHGHFNHHVTGYYGRVTQNAVREYQRKNRLTVDGIVGPQTISHLLSKTGGQANSASSTQTTPTPTQSQTVNPTAQIDSVQFTASVLRIGSSGSQVRQLQQSLKELGHFNHEVTGYYGNITATAVRSFQQSQRLTVDGIAGSQTFRALTQVVNGQSGSTNNATNNNTTTNTTTNSSTNTTTTQPTSNQTTSTNEANTAQTTPAQTVAQPVPQQQAQPAPHVSQDFQVMNVIADAAGLVGTPYVWGGTTPKGFDCSGFVQYVFKNQGVNIPRTVAQQWAAGTSVSKPSVGDLVFFETISSGPSHNGIYIGNNQFIHSGSSTGVIVASLNNSYWAPRYLGAKRVH